MLIHRRTGWTAQSGLRALLAVLSCLALIGTGCSGSGGLKAGDAATLVGGFGGEISVDGGDWTARADGGSVPDGARVRAGEQEVRLSLRDGTVRLGPGSAATVTAQAVQLERGELLVDSAGGLEARVEDTVIAAGGIVRVASGVAATVGVYEGSAVIRRPAQERELPSLRQMDLAAFRLEPTGSPLRYRPDDAWDQELLGAAIAFDGEVARLARGMEIEFGTRPQPPAFYREFAGQRAMPVLSEAAPVTRGRAFGPPSDVLLTMFIARTVTQGRLVDTIRHVAQLRGAGARWGLIAMELDVASDALVAAVDELDSERLALADRAPETAQGTGISAGSTAGSEVADAGSETASSPGGSASSGERSGSGGGGKGGGGGNDEDGDGDEDPPDEDPPDPVSEVVSAVVSAIEEHRPPGDNDDDDEEGGGINAPVALPPLPPLPSAPNVRPLR